MSADEDRVRLRGPDGSSLQVALHGGQPLSWICRGRERLYLSPRARFAPGQAIRGGVPVIFPQFSDRGPGPRHGFARVRAWTHVSEGPAGEGPAGEGPASEGHFLLRGDPATHALWPHDFEAELSVALGADTLVIALRVRNTGNSALAFTAALHTYLAVDDLAELRLQGLGGRAYQDAARGGAAALQHESELRFDGGELDRLYPGTAPDTDLRLIDGAHALRIDAEGFADTVVWNPGAALAAGIADLGPGEERHFVCVEAAAVATPIALAAGAQWCGRQTLTVTDRTPTP